MSGAGRRLTAGAVGVAGLVLVAGGQVVGNRHTVEDRLAGGATGALDRAGLDTVRVVFTGRDAEVTGPAAELGRASGVVRGVRGVRSVHAVAAAPVPERTRPKAEKRKTGVRTAAVPTPTALPTGDLRPMLPVSLVFQGRTITASGQVPSRRTRSKVVDTVRGAGSSVGWKVVDHLRVVPSVDARARPEFYPGLSRIVGAVPTDGDRLVVRFDVDRVTMRGHPGSVDLERSLLEAGRTAVIPPYWVQDGLDVATT